MMSYLRKNWLALVVLALFSFSIHLYRISEPIYDRHNFRQTDTYAIALRMYWGEASVLYPTFFHTHDPNNTERYFLAEFPIYEALIALLFIVFGEQLVLARVLSIALTIVASLSLYYIGQTWFSRRVGFLAALAFNIFPSIFFWGRAISPDILALSAFTAAMAVLVSEKTTARIWIASIVYTVAVLTKPSYVFFMPVFAAQLYVRRDRTEHHFAENLFSLLEEIVRFFLLPLSALLLWRGWIATFDPSTRTDPSFPGLMHGYVGYFNFWTASRWPEILFTERLFGELLTPLGAILALLGLVSVMKRRPRYRILTLVWLGCCVCTSLLISWGSFIHDYYLLPWLPFAAIFVGYAVEKSSRVLTQWMHIHTLIQERLLMVVAGTGLLFVLFWLGPVPWARYTQSYFGTQAYNLYGGGYTRDYERIISIVDSKEQVIVVMAEYTPFVLNTIRREGNVLVVTPDQPCPEPEQFFTKINDLLRIEPKQYLVFQKHDFYSSNCRRDTLGSYLFRRYALLYQGEELELYAIKEPTLEIAGDQSSLVLTSRNLGRDARVEVGGISGNEGTVLVEPDWVSQPDGSLQAVISQTEDWVSFKIYWENPLLTTKNPAWQVSTDGWVLRSF